MALSTIDSRIAALGACLEKSAPCSPTEPLLVGVDLGTAYTVLVVLNARFEPLACAMEFAQVIKDGLVVDYLGAMELLRRLKKQLESRLGVRLTRAAIAVPPGTGDKDCQTHRHVVEGAGMAVTSVLDEPTAANAVLGIDNGVIVDIGGGTTGLSILEGGRVIHTADEPTGGTHLTLVLAGNYKISFEEAEVLKKDPSRQGEILMVVRPVIQKMATIVRRQIAGYTVPGAYLVGGTCCLAGMEEIFAAEIGIPVYKPANPLLVTPLGIAMNAHKEEPAHGC